MGHVRFRRVERCAFCENKANSKEHAWPNWVLKHLDMKVPQILGELEGHPALFDPGQRALKLPCVCEGWMKALEDATIQILTPMIDGELTKLGVLQQWTIATWATKTAMVFEYVSSNRDLYYTDEDRFILRELVNPVPPSFTGIWLGHYLGPFRIFTLGTDGGSGMPTRTSVQAYVTTMGFGQVGIQVISARADEGKTGDTVIHPKHGPWAETTLRIWPSEKLRRWPPPTGFGASTYEALREFHTRFHSPTSELGGFTADDVLKVCALHRRDSYPAH